MSRRLKKNTARTTLDDPGPAGSQQTTYTQQELSTLEDTLCKGGRAAQSEDASSKESPAKESPSRDMSGPWRPAYGAEGRPITVLANYMQLQPLPMEATSPAGYASHLEIILHSYAISITPDVAGRKRAQVVRLWLDQMMASEASEASGLDAPTPLAAATDFQERIITDRVVSAAALVQQVKYRREGDSVPRDNAVEYTVTLDAIAALRFQFSDLLHHLKTLGLPQGLPRESPSYASLDTEPGAVATPADWTQALNIILNHYARVHPTSRTIVGGRRVFGIGPPAAGRIQAAEISNHVSPSLRIGGALEAVRGFYSSARLATGRVLVNVNVTTAAFFHGNVPLTQLIHEFVRQKHAADAQSTQWNAATLAGIDQFIRRLRIRATHMVDRPTATYTIYGLAKPYQPAASGSKKSKAQTGKTAAEQAPNPHPPIVEALGASPQGVQFWYSLDRANPEAGSYTTVASYFAQQYPAQKLDAAYPAVNVGNAEHPIFLPADVCIVLPGQVATRAPLDEQQRTALVGFAVRPPADNASDIVKKAPHILGFASPDDTGDARVKTGALAANLVHRFGLTVKDKQLIQVRARILPAPSLTFFRVPGMAGAASAAAMPPTALFRPHPQNANWNLKDTKFALGGQLGSDWACITIANGQQHWQQIQPTVTSALQRFVESLGRHGIVVGKPRVIDGVPNTPTQIGNMLQKLLEQSRGSIKLVLVVLQNTSAPTYNVIKYLGDVRLGVCTVCVDFRKFTKLSNGPYMSNVALKVNLKLGGCNHRLALGAVAGSTGGRTGGSGGLFRGGSPGRGRGRGQGSALQQLHHSESSVLQPASLAPIDPDTTMIVGIDVTHPSPGSTSSAPSIAAMVASTDSRLSQWPAELRVQEHAREEMVANTTLEDMAICHLKRWQAHHGGSLPRSVLVYRDGVSEGQYELVIKEEIPQLRRAFGYLYGTAPPPPLTVVIVGKRHHTRFYPADGEADGSTHRDRTGNCLPGTVVDRGVTLASSWDFFLQAHRAIKGTARPAHYHVVCDEIFRKRCADLHSGGNGNGNGSGNEKIKALTTKFKKMAMGVDLSRRPGGASGGGGGGGGGGGARDLETSAQNASDALQRVTQALCFIFGRATGAVGIATPAYYADLACDRARRYLTKWYDGVGDDGKDEQRSAEEVMAEQAQRIAVHGRLKETMFYI